MNDMKKERECLACNVNNPTVETPMKHDEYVCVNNNNNNNALLETAKKSLTQNILNPRDHNQVPKEQQVMSDKKCTIEPSVNGIGPNKENMMDESSQNTQTEVEVITESAPAVTSKNSKNRKKKKSKKKSGQVVVFTIHFKSV